jgi:hypothetical protein
MVEVEPVAAPPDGLTDSVCLSTNNEKRVFFIDKETTLEKNKISLLHHLQSQQLHHLIFFISIIIIFFS